MGASLTKNVVPGIDDSQGLLDRLVGRHRSIWFGAHLDRFDTSIDVIRLTAYGYECDPLEVRLAHTVRVTPSAPFLLMTRLSSGSRSRLRDTYRYVHAGTPAYDPVPVKASLDENDSSAIGGQTASSSPAGSRSPPQGRGTLFG